MESPTGKTLCDKCESDRMQHSLEQLLYSAVEFNHHMCVESLLEEGADVNWLNQRVFSCTPLMKAPQKGHTKILTLLLKAGADVNQSNQTGYSALMCAASNGQDGCVDLLLKAGADVNTSDGLNLTAVIKASQAGHEKCVNLLVDAGSDVKAQKNLSLFYAMRKGYSKVIDVLVNAGADVNGENWRDRTALIEAAVCCRKDPGHCRKCMELLIRAGADVNQSCSEGEIAINIASRNGCHEAVELLIKSGADVNKLGQYEFSPLMEAVANGQDKCAKLLLKAGADVNFMHYWGVTPLMCVGVPFSLLFNLGEYFKRPNYATTEGNFFACVQLLLQSGVKINLRSAVSNNTLKLQLALHSISVDRSDICRLLYAAGETLDGPTDENLPDCLMIQTLRFNLKHLCREAIRKHLLSLDAHTHLFNRIPQLGLPRLLVQFLLYDVTLNPIVKN